MKRTLFMIVATLAVVLALGACSPTTDQANQAGGECPTPGADTLLYTMEPQGYCLLYPATHQPIASSETGTDFVVGDLMNVTEPRFSVSVSEAGGLDTATAAAQIEADFGLPDMTTRSYVVLDGQEAVVLDNMPGQDINRRVIVVHNGRLYDLMFAPVGADYGDLATRTESVYQTVVESFTFMP